MLQPMVMTNCLSKFDCYNLHYKKGTQLGSFFLSPKE